MMNIILKRAGISSFIDILKFGIAKFDYYPAPPDAPPAPPPPPALAPPPAPAAELTVVDATVTTDVIA